MTDSLPGGAESHRAETCSEHLIWSLTLPFRWRKVICQALNSRQQKVVTVSVTDTFPLSWGGIEEIGRAGGRCWCCCGNPRHSRHTMRQFWVTICRFLILTAIIGAERGMGKGNRLRWNGMMFPRSERCVCLVSVVGGTPATKCEIVWWNHSRRRRFFLSVRPYAVRFKRTADELIVILEEIQQNFPGRTSDSCLVL